MRRGRTPCLGALAPDTVRTKTSLDGQVEDGGATRSNVTKRVDSGIHENAAADKQGSSVWEDEWARGQEASSLSASEEACAAATLERQPREKAWSWKETSSCDSAGEEELDPTSPSSAIGGHRQAKTSSSCWRMFFRFEIIRVCLTSRGQGRGDLDS